MTGIVAFALAVLTLAGLITGILLATGDQFEMATYAAYAASALGAAAVLVAIVALIVKQRRGLAVAAIVLGLLANPLLLTPALTGIGRLWS